MKKLLPILFTLFCSQIFAQAGFVASNYSSCSNNTVSFTDTSAGAIMWQWNFGDGQTSTQQNPTHVFLATGNLLTYDSVSLTITPDSINFFTSTQVITVLPLPTITISGNSSICTGASTTLFAGGATTYIWNTSATTSSINVTPSSTTNYNVTGTDVNGCVNSANQTVTVSACGSAPIAGFVANNGCTGVALAFTDTSANMPTSWSWNFGDGQTSTQQNPTHTYTVPGTYNVFLYVSNATGPDSLIKPISITNCPMVPVSGFVSSNNMICQSGSVSFTDTSANTPTSWSWNFGDGQTSSLQNPSHFYNTPGVYTVTLAATNTAGTSTNSFSQNITVQTSPSVTISAGTTTICAGNSVTLNASGASTYSWSNSATTISITVSPTSTTSYTVVGTSGGCSNSATQIITVNICSPITVTSPNGGEQWAEGSTQNITWTYPTGDSVNVYYSLDNATTWTSLGMHWGSNTLAWTLPTGTLATNCYVKVEDVYNNSIFDTNDAYFAVVASAPSVSLIATNPTCNGMCNGSITSTVTGGLPPFIYQWVSLPDTLPNVNNVCAGTYILIVTDANSVQGSDTINVTQPPALSVSISGTNTICLGSSTTLSATPVGGTQPYSYNWNPVSSTATSVSVSPSITTMHYVSVTDNNGCTANSNYNVTVNSLPAVTAVPSVNTICIGSGQTVTLSATGATTYSWSSGSNGPVANVNPVTTTSYSVVGTDANSCSDTAFVTVNVNPIQSLYSGNVFFKDNGAPINVTSGKVYIYNVDSVGWIGATDSATIGAGGNFNMGTVPFGNYKVYITPNQTAFPFLANTYYNMEYTWDSAAVVSFTCADTTFMQVELDSISPLPTFGGVTVGGDIIADSSFTGKVAAQGDPIPGVDVALEQNPGSVMLATTTTDAAGHYTFNNIPLTPSGFHYTIIANIPGFGLDSSYNLIVTTAETDLNYFVSDSTIYIDSVKSAIYEGVKHIDKINESTDFKVYPNPYKNGTNINFELKEKSVVQLEIYNALGEKVAVLENTTKEAGIYKYSFSAKAIGYSTGIYFAKLRINNSLSVAKLMEVE